VFPVRYGQTYRAELSFKSKIGRWILSEKVIAIKVGTVKIFHDIELCCSTACSTP
jgi:hypothetical protein